MSAAASRNRSPLPRRQPSASSASRCCGSSTPVAIGVIPSAAAMPMPARHHLACHRVAAQCSHPGAIELQIPDRCTGQQIERAPCRGPLRRPTSCTPSCPRHRRSTASRAMSARSEMRSSSARAGRRPRPGSGRCPRRNPRAARDGGRAPNDRRTSASAAGREAGEILLEAAEDGARQPGVARPWFPHFQEFRRTDLPAQRVQPVQVADPGDQTTARQVVTTYVAQADVGGSRWRRAVRGRYRAAPGTGSRKVSVKKHTSDEPQRPRFSGGRRARDGVGRTTAFLNCQWPCGSTPRPAASSSRR